jgi:hypothetical protein
MANFSAILDAILAMVGCEAPNQQFHKCPVSWAEVNISNMVIYLFLMATFLYFYLLICHFLALLQSKPILIHDITSISWYFSLVPAFSYRKD